jgi:hypothetical protein
MELVRQIADSITRADHPSTWVRGLNAPEMSPLLSHLPSIGHRYASRNSLEHHLKATGISLDIEYSRLPATAHLAELGCAAQCMSILRVPRPAA